MKAAALLLQDGSLESARTARYSGWEKPENQALLSASLEEISARVLRDAINPQPVSGRQERLENLWNRHV